jgi:hypothetical protein
MGKRIRRVVRRGGWRVEVAAAEEDYYTRRRERESIPACGPSSPCLGTASPLDGEELNAGRQRSTGHGAGWRPVGCYCGRRRPFDSGEAPSRPSRLERMRTVNPPTGGGSVGWRRAGWAGSPSRRDWESPQRDQRAPSQPRRWPTRKAGRLGNPHAEVFPRCGARRRARSTALAAFGARGIRIYPGDVAGRCECAESGSLVAMNSESTYSLQVGRQSRNLVVRKHGCPTSR